MRIIYMTKVLYPDRDSDYLVRIRQGKRDVQYSVYQSSWDRMLRFSKGKVERYDLEGGITRLVKHWIQ